MTEKWIKYLLSTQPGSASMDRTFAEHAESMGGYRPDDAYASRDRLFQSRLFRDARFINYADFIGRHVKKSDRILSIASGRCINELLLISQGYQVVCSDLDYPDCYPATRRLFPGLDFRLLDILKDPPEGGYDTALVLSLIYLFDDGELDTFFRNMRQGLVDGGSLILDSAGSEPGILSGLFHHLFLPVEAYLMKFLKTITGKKQYHVTRKDFGYRRTNREIAAFAEKNGFDLVERQDYGYSLDLNRGHVIPFLVNNTRFMEPLLDRLGRGMPYQRMFLFRKRPSQV
jgi:hypothetical protein